VRASRRKIIPDYIITHEIGSGGFATVYKALNNHGKEVAIKLPKFLDETVSTSILDQFRTEADIWKKLKHNNIVHFYKSDVQPFPYIAIEYMAGTNLKEVMEKHRFSLEEAVDIMLQILDGMSFAHRMASVHRDIKPENILFTQDGVPKISDWGIGKFMASEGVTQTIGTKGTLAYCAPEQISKKKFGKIDWSTDIFQLGIIFYEMLTGIHPFYDEDPAGIIGNILGEEPESPSTIDSKIPKFLDKIIMKALNKDKSSRWSSAGVMYDRLKFAINKKEENIKKYKKTLLKALKDGKITKDEEEMLSEVRDHLDVTIDEHRELLSEILSK